MISGRVLGSAPNLLPHIVYQPVHGFLRKTEDDDFGMAELFVKSK